MRALRTVLACGAVLAAIACAEGEAVGAVGDLDFVDCVANEGRNGCVDPPIDPNFDPVRGAEAIATYGDSVYLTSILNLGAVSWFTREADGSLEIDGCISRDGPTTGCEGPLLTLNSAAGVAVSADGENVYVVSTGGALPEPGSVTTFERDADGSLTFQACIADDGAFGCEEADLDSIDRAFDITLVGDDAYVASTEGFVTHLSRRPDGSLEYEECFADGGAAGCTDPGGASLGALLLPSAIASSPDGENVYVTATNGASLTAFSRDPDDGSLSFLECHANGGGGGCEDPPKDVMGAALDAVVSPDGGSVYVGAYSGDAVVSFSRGAGGSLDFQDCIADDDEDGCVDAPLDAVGHVYSLAVDPAGETVYATADGPGTDDGAVLVLDRGVAGKLGWQGCLANDGADGCLDLPKDTLEEPHGIAVSDDGQSVFAAAYWGESISAFEREAVPLAPLLTDTDPDSPADYNEPAIKGSAQAGTTVKLYDDAACGEPAVATGTAAQLAGSGIVATVLDDSTTVFHATATDAEGTSPCSAGIVYDEVSAGPGLTAVPTLTGTDPPSPADDETPHLLGSAESGTTINVFTNPSCSGAPIATGSAAALAGPGIEVAVADNSSTTFHANATGSLGTSPCSSGLTYVESTPPALAAPLPLVAATPAAAVALGEARVLTRRAQVAGRVLRLRIACAAVPGGICRGSLRLLAKGRRLAARGFKLGAGRRATLRVRLSKRGLRLVRAAGGGGLAAKVRGPRLRAANLRLRAAPAGRRS